MGIVCSDDLGHMTWEIRSWKYGRESLAWHGLYLILSFVLFFLLSIFISNKDAAHIESDVEFLLFLCSVWWLYSLQF